MSLATKIAAKYAIVAILKDEKGVRQVAASARDLVPTIEKAERLMEDLEDWIKRFDRVLLAARSESDELPKDRVWQDRLVRYFEEADTEFESLQHVDEVLESIYLSSSDGASQMANEARQLVAPPRMAQIEYAISDIDFAKNPLTDRDGITYSVMQLRSWSSGCEKWLKSGTQALRNLKRQAIRSV